MNTSAPPTVAVLGAGLLGRAIAQCFAVGGCPTRLYDVSDVALDGARRAIDAAQLRMVELGAWTTSAAAATSNIESGTVLQRALDGADLVIESVPENRDLKRTVLSDAERLVDPSAVLASNSSSFSASEIGVSLLRPEQLLNLHFFNPAQVVPLVEIAPSPRTSPEVIDRAVRWCRDAGKTPVVLARETNGMIANRLQAALLREALALLEEGVASVEQIDTVVTASIGRRLSHFGVFEVADLGGLAVFEALCERLFPELASGLEVPPLLRKLVRSGALGVGCGAGFRTYSPREAASRPDQMFAALAQRLVDPTSEVDAT